MKRKNIVEKLLKEGISQQTISVLNDKQLNLLFNRINEQILNIPKGNTDAIKKAQDSEEEYMTYEEEEIETELEDDDEFHPMTTKNEINEMIKNKLKK
jgi:hypothetical protein